MFFLGMYITPNAVSVVLIYLLLFMIMVMISYYWIAVVSKLTPPTFFCRAISAVIFCFSDPSLPITLFPYIIISPLNIGMALALSRDMVWSSFNCNIRLLAVIYSTFITLSWIFVVTLSWPVLIRIAFGYIFYHNSTTRYFPLCVTSGTAVLVPGMVGRFIGEYTTVECGYLFAAVGGGLTAVLASTVLSYAPIIKIDTGLSDVVPLLEENFQKLRSLQGDLEEVHKRLKITLSSLR